MTTRHPACPEQPGTSHVLPGRLARFSGQAMTPARWAVADLALLAAAETILTYVDSRAGLVAYAALLLVLLWQYARAGADATLVWYPDRDRPGLAEARVLPATAPARGLFLALTLAPLTRLVTFALPLAVMPEVSWYAAVSLPLFVAAVLAARRLQLAPAGIGLQFGTGLPVQILIGLSGIVLGYAEYQIVKPAPLVRSLTLGEVWLPALILMIGTGLFEELIFRGLLQRTAVDLLGRNAVLYVVAVYAILHLGYKSATDLVLAAGLGLVFGVVAATTRSILGVALAHGLANVMVFIALPALALGGSVIGAGAPPSGHSRVAVIQTPTQAAATAPFVRTAENGTIFLGGAGRFDSPENAGEPCQCRHGETQQERRQSNGETLAKSLRPDAG